MASKVKFEVKLTFLKDNYPAAAVFILKFMGRRTELKEYFELCQNYADDIVKSSRYTQGYLQLHLQQIRDAQKLTIGKPSKLWKLSLDSNPYQLF